jgi:hypothetical protein
LSTQAIGFIIPEDTYPTLAVDVDQDGDVILTGDGGVLWLSWAQANALVLHLGQKIAQFNHELQHKNPPPKLVYSGEPEALRFGLKQGN